MNRPLPPTVRISFEGAQDEQPPYVTVYNPEVLSFACLTHLSRFGLTGNRNDPMTGRLKGTRKNLLEMIRTYGNNIQVTRPDADRPSV